jgi:hypothetical protein
MYCRHMQTSEGHGLGALEFSTLFRQVTEGVRKGGGASPSERRQELGTLLSMVWVQYGGHALIDAPIDIIDQLYMCAFRAINLAIKLEKVPPVQGITIGDISRELEATLELLKDIANLDTVIIRSYAADGSSNYDKVRPSEALQGIFVKRARDLGVSWKRIGESLGMSAQGIQQKAQDRGWTVDSGMMGGED